jgi:hypothetical protein
MLELLSGFQILARRISELKVVGLEFTDGKPFRLTEFRCRDIPSIECYSTARRGRTGVDAALDRRGNGICGQCGGQVKKPYPSTVSWSGRMSDEEEPRTDISFHPTEER